MTSVVDERRGAGFAAMTADQTLDRVARAARPDVVFGQPVERGDTTIIPCCEVALGMGMGGGSGTNPVVMGTGPDIRRGEGIGAGGGTAGRPVAVIVLSRNGQVQVQPIVDATKVALAALTTAGFMLFWLAQLRRTARMMPTRGLFARTGPTMRELARLSRR
jgi:uncharacterized spore protein YtfJ